MKISSSVLYHTLEYYEIGSWQYVFFSITITSDYGHGWVAFCCCWLGVLSATWTERRTFFRLVLKISCIDSRSVCCFLSSSSSNNFLCLKLGRRTRHAENKLAGRGDLVAREGGWAVKAEHKSYQVGTVKRKLFDCFPYDLKLWSYWERNAPKREATKNSAGQPPVERKNETPKFSTASGLKREKDNICTLLFWDDGIGHYIYGHSLFCSIKITPRIAWKAVSKIEQRRYPDVAFWQSPANLFVQVLRHKVYETKA